MGDLYLEEAIKEAYGREMPVLVGCENGEVVGILSGISDRYDPQSVLEIHFPEWVIKVLPTFMEGFVKSLTAKYDERDLIDTVRLYGANAHNEYLKTLFNSYSFRKII